MQISSFKFKPLKPAVIGALAGYFFLHLYAMLAYSFYQTHLSGMERAEGVAGIWDYFKATLSTALNPAMLHMGIPFGILGAVAGLFFGYWRESERRRGEIEKRAYTVEALKQLMITLSHYLLNASTAIGGFARHISRDERDPEHKEHLEVIEEESEKIEAVVKSLQSLKSIMTENYGTDSDTLMIDIKKQIEEHLKKYNKVDKGGSI